MPRSTPIGERRITAVPSPRMSIGWSPVIFSALSA